ncbi:MAG: type IVB secretion system protein IcmH/DotU [Gammaproteobacteria bacterium]
MIATHNDPTLIEATPLSSPQHLKPVDASASPVLLTHRTMTHHPKAGLNPVVDTASYLISVLGKLKELKSYRQLSKLQSELVQEVNFFQETLNNLGYNGEYVVVSRYVICAVFDDIITNTAWGAQGQWDAHSLLAAFNLDTQHQDKFFSILERAVKEPSVYIDLMELMYICLSMGYKGQYRATEHNQYQLEQITHHLYKHIRAHRGNFSKTLSPTPLKPAAETKKTISSRISPLFVFFVTVCLVTTIFVGLGYLMDVISNEAYQNIAQIQTSASQSNPG